MSESNINAAIRLALQFSEDADIPTRLKGKGKPKVKKSNEDPSKVKDNSKVEQRFQDKIKSWERFIETLNSKIDKTQASRFINLKPTVEAGIASAAYCQDFIDFNDYFILRRDMEGCTNEELGQLAQLITEFQKRIEKKGSGESKAYQQTTNNII